MIDAINVSMNVIRTSLITNSIILQNLQISLGQGLESELFVNSKEYLLHIGFDRSNKCKMIRTSISMGTNLPSLILSFEIEAHPDEE
ncbi:3069_t:CDS:2 [Funneliformis geosporum]|uniref:3069_t:CDS:1 n=1 Tax=Funneliformis geosporum TaxID=1117311 RepID=A0A9W4WRM6_9GLOM|nr:3069_t:CDS:2 [Funneliformis geosporum]